MTNTQADPQAKAFVTQQSSKAITKPVSSSRFFTEVSAPTSRLAHKKLLSGWFLSIIQLLINCYKGWSLWRKFMHLLRVSGSKPGTSSPVHSCSCLCQWSKVSDWQPMNQDMATPIPIPAHQPQHNSSFSEKNLFSEFIFEYEVHSSVDSSRGKASRRTESCLQLKCHDFWQNGWTNLYIVYFYLILHAYTIIIPLM